MPQPSCRAVIDVGSNSVKLLVGRVYPGPRVEPVFERGIQTRLGAGFFKTRRLRQDAIERAAAVVAQFRGEAERHEAESLRVFATAAAREAENRDELLQALEAAAGRRVEVLSGDEEATLGFRGVCTQAALSRGPIIVTDVGGGSSEFIVGRNAEALHHQSFPIGAVRLFDHLAPPERPAPGDLRRCREFIANFLAAEVIPALRESLARSLEGQNEERPRLVATGGTVAILARIHLETDDFNREQIEATELSLETLTRITDRLWSLDFDARRQVRGLPPERADIILTGVAIHEGILKALDIPALRPSTRGVRYAALLDPP